MKSDSRLDWLAAGLLWLLTAAVLGAGASRLGYYADDAGWLATLPDVHSPGQLWAAMRNYMPGRNLHPFWHYLFYQAVGGDAMAHLPALHRIQSALDGLAVAVFYLLLRSLRLPAPAVWLAAGCFAFWPLHGETHFWLESLPMNLLSTLLVLVFAATSMALARGHRRWWLWALDAAAFAGALFTYDQVFLVLLLLAALRAASLGYLVHLPYLAAPAFCAWLRLSRGGGPMPPGLRSLLATVLGNISQTFRSDFGTAAWRHIEPLLANATPTDWLLAGALAAAFAAGALWLPRPEAPSRRWPLFVAATLFWVAAYAPVWLWYISRRHQYLPSAGLFAALAVVLAWLLERARILLTTILTAGVALGIAANRGESRFWEIAFSAKQQLFQELKQDLAGKQVLVLDSFPIYLSTAFLITVHDANHGPQLLLPNVPLTPEFQGFLGATPAPGGLFLATHTHDGPENFRYSNAADVLVVRFDAWRDGRLDYQKNPARPLPYEVLSSRCEPKHAPFAAPLISARREGDDLMTTLQFQSAVAPSTYLTALFRFWQRDRFQAWGDGHSPGNVWPVLLGGPGQECLQVLRLRRFRRSDRIRVDFFQATQSAPPALLGSFEARVQP